MVGTDIQNNSSCELRRRAARDEEGRMMVRTIVGPRGEGEGERRVMQRKRSVNLKLMWFVVIGRFPTCKSHLKVVRFQYSTRFTSSTEMVFVLVFGIGHVGDAVNNVLSPKCILFIYYYVYLHLCSLRRSLQEISKSTVSLEQLNPIYLNNP
uniref:Uncharacterized protein n=1 Tax=Vitis vinifera TaxID=29760 RepID=F6HKA3_VITVI